jgi:MFS transporter, Spinster family, sphingosine-1-phosphate transporter
MIRRPAIILAILTGLNLLNYMDRTVLAAVLPSIQDGPGSLGLGNLQAGALATAFLIGYFVTSPIFGAVADRAPRLRTRLMTVGVLVWSLATFLSGHAFGFWSMIGARALVGVGEASYAALAPTLIDDMASEKSRGRQLAVFYLAIPIGSALGYLLGGWLEAHFTWRGAFYAAGAPGVVLALACLLIVDPRHGAVARARPPVLQMLAPLARQKLYRRAVLGYCAQTFALGGFAHWAPKYIHARYDVGLEQANFTFGTLLVVAGFVGTGVGGTWADRAARGLDREGGARAHLRVCGISALLGAPFALACILAPSALGFFAFIFVCETFIFLSAAPINGAILASVPLDLRASGMALSTFAIHLLGDLWSPPLVGAIADRSSMKIGMLLLPLAILASGVVWLRKREQTAA